MEQFLPGAAVDRSTGASGRVIKSVDLSSLTTISDLRITNRGWYDFVLLLLHLPFFFSGLCFGCFGGFHQSWKINGAALRMVEAFRFCGN